MTSSMRISEPEGEPTPSDRPSAGELLARYSVGEQEQTRSAGERGKLAAQLTAALARSAHAAGAGAVATGRWLGDLLIEAAPHIPVRDLETLQRHHRGLHGDLLADALVRNAARATAAVGVAGGALSAVKWTAPMTMLTFPIQLAVQTLAVAAIEVKLVAELHEAYAVPVAGTGSQRGAAYVMAWANRRGVNPAQPASLLTVVGPVARQQVGRRVAARAGLNIGTLAPMMAGAAIGGRSNYRQTQKLSDALRGDLRRRAPLTGGLTGRVVNRLLDPRRRRGSTQPPA